MIDITTILYNILHSRYGRDVRQSIHDGLSDVNANAKEALETANTIVTDKYSASKQYAVGDFCIYNNVLYKCKATARGIVPTNTTYWTATSVGGELNNIHTSSTETYTITSSMWFGNDTSGYYIRPENFRNNYGTKVINFVVVDWGGYSNFSFYGLQIGLGIRCNKNTLSSIKGYWIYRD